MLTWHRRLLPSGDGTLECAEDYTHRIAMNSGLAVSCAISLCVVTLATTAVNSREDPVTIARLPPGGIQPQVAVDLKGTTHVVYFVGEPANGDLFYATLSSGTFSKPVRVNSEPGSAIATGTVRGVQIAIGRNGRIHVVWNGSGRAIPKAPGDSTPMLYARLDPGREAFEPQRNIVQTATGLDGGGAVAADDRGRVFVAWHAGGANSKGEGDRGVWLATSANDGLSFSKEMPVSDASTGACGCCGMDALIDRTGSLFLLYRSARDVVHRDTYLLSSPDGLRFSSTKLQEWNIGACPMSTFSLAQGSDSILAAWETDGQVQFAKIIDSVPQQIVAPPIAIGNVKKRRHPSLAVNARGQILLAWSDGTAWQKGGALAWQLYEKDGRTRTSGRSDGVPVWGLSAAFARPDGSFTIVY